IYTTWGGLRGVVVTDVLQSFIMFGGTLLAILMIVKYSGSVHALLPAEWPQHWSEWKFFDARARVSFMTMVITVFGQYVCTAGSDQMSIQRYLATRDSAAARRALLTSLIANGLVYVVLAALGIALMTYYQAHPELIMAGLSLSDAADSLLPLFIVQGLPAGIAGLVFSGLLAAAMSSLSSGINSSSHVIINDFILRFKKVEPPQQTLVHWARAISLIIGLATICLSLVMGRIKGNLMEVTFKTVNLLTAPLFVPFFMGLFVPRVNENAVLIGTLTSIVAAVCIGFADVIFGQLISFLWIIPGSFAVGVVTSMLAECILTKPTQDRFITNGN
ncbi:Na+:solute symporter, partial [bacterium]|nr:Na+:solute symporter [bacterium]